MGYDEICQQLEAVRRSGKTNMFDVDTVQVIAYESDFHQLVTWIEEHDNAEYLKLANRTAAAYQGETLDVDPVPDTITREVEL